MVGMNPHIQASVIATLLGSAVEPKRWCLEVSGLEQGIIGDKSLHTLPLQQLHGSPVQLATVLRLASRPQLLLDVPQPQIWSRENMLKALQNYIT